MARRPDSDDPTTARLVGKTNPHGAQELWLVDQADKPEDSIYELRDAHNGTRRVGLLGSELDGLMQLWTAARDVAAAKTRRSA